MMLYKFHAEARIEYLDAIKFYATRQPDVAARFTVEIEAALERIVELPMQWRKVYGDVRRCLTCRFPYGILYSVETDYVFVLAVMHLSRDPQYWLHRLPPTT